MVAGGGVSCVVEGRKVLIGNLELLKKKQVIISSEAQDTSAQLHGQGNTLVFVAVEGELCGVIALHDKLRTESAFVVRKLKEKGFEVCMVSGDHERTCQVVAGQVGISAERVYAGVKPLEKSEIVKKFQDQGKNVLMVGDGVNDAVALGQANVGVAVGSASRISESAADIVLLSTNLKTLLTAVHLCGRIHRQVKINLGWAFVYNVLMIPIAAGALYYPGNVAIPPAFAGLSEILSTFPVFGLSMLLYNYRPPETVEPV